MSFFWFSRGFFWFLTKSIKNLEKTKKNKKNKIADPNSPACTYMGLAIFFFLVFSRFFLVFDQKYQKPRENQKNKKTKLQTLTHQLVPTWVLQFWLCLLFYMMSDHVLGGDFSLLNNVVIV